MSYEISFSIWFACEIFVVVLICAVFKHLSVFMVPQIICYPTLVPAFYHLSIHSEVIKHTSGLFFIILHFKKSTCIMYKWDQTFTLFKASIKCCHFDFDRILSLQTLVWLDLRNVIRNNSKFTEIKSWLSDIDARGEWEKQTDKKTTNWRAKQHL